MYVYSPNSMCLFEYFLRFLKNTKDDKYNNSNVIDVRPKVCLTSHEN